MEQKSVRIDKWLWYVRIFKTRSIATQECQSGKVKVADESIKPSRMISTGDIISIRQKLILKTVKVKDIPKARIGAKLVEDFLEDLTPEEEYKKIEVQKDQFYYKRDRGKGRPTKKDRRKLDELDWW